MSVLLLVRISESGVAVAVVAGVHRVVRRVQAVHVAALDHLVEVNLVKIDSRLLRQPAHHLDRFTLFYF